MSALVLPDVGRRIMNNAIPAFLQIFVSLLIAGETGRRLPRPKIDADGSAGVSLMEGRCLRCSALPAVYA